MFDVWSKVIGMKTEKETDLHPLQVVYIHALILKSSYWLKTKASTLMSNFIHFKVPSCDVCLRKWFTVKCWCSSSYFCRERLKDRSSFEVWGSVFVFRDSLGFFLVKNPLFVSFFPNNWPFCMFKSRDFINYPPTSPGGFSVQKVTDPNTRPWCFPLRPQSCSVKFQENIQRAVLSFFLFSFPNFEW